MTFWYAPLCADAIEPITSTVPEGSTVVDDTTPLEACENAASVATGGDMIERCGTESVFYISSGGRVDLNVQLVWADSKGKAR